MKPQEKESRYAELPLAIISSNRRADAIALAIHEVFQRLLYLRLFELQVAAASRVANAPGPSGSYLERALREGKVVLFGGHFYGRFTPAITRELTKLGASYAKLTASYYLTIMDIPAVISAAAWEGREKFAASFNAMMEILNQQNLPAEIAEAIAAHPAIDKLIQGALAHVDTSIRRSITAKAARSVALHRVLGEDEKQRIAAEYINDQKRWISDMAEGQIKRLRQRILRAAERGDRADQVARAIQTQDGMTRRKAQFVARQELTLLMTKFREVRYTKAGINHYRWQCVSGTSAHPVRPSHKILDGKIFRWDDPPITTGTDEPPRRNNPGQDYNCRCIARPVVRLRENE